MSTPLSDERKREIRRWVTRYGPNAIIDPDEAVSLLDEIAALARELGELRAEEKKWRRLLATAYAGAHLYRDDGELQDNRHPFIDFRRDDPDEIERLMVLRGKAALAAAGSRAGREGGGKE